MTKCTLVHVDTMCCEPIVRRTASGELLLLAQCGDVKEPAPDNRVLVFHSKDDGVTWTKGEDILPLDKRALYQTEVFVDEHTVYAFMTAHNGKFCLSEHFVLKSEDDGYTWEKVGGIDGLPEFVFIRGGVRLGKKTLFPYHGFAVSHEEQKRLAQEDKYIWESDIEELDCGVIVFEDGKKEIHSAFRLPVFREEKRRWAWFEPTVAALPSGKLLMLFRIDGSGVLWKCESADEGKTWGETERTDIPSPNNKPKLLNLPDGRIALLHTPNGRIGFPNRNPLELWITADGGKTWAKQTVSSFPAWYSYPDGFYEKEGDRVLFTVDFNRHDLYFFDCKIEV